MRLPFDYATAESVSSKWAKLPGLILFASFVHLIWKIEQNTSSWLFHFGSALSHIDRRNNWCVWVWVTIETFILISVI